MHKIVSLVWFKIFPAHFGGQKGIAAFYESLSRYYPLDCLCAASNEIVEASGFRIIPALPNGKKQFINPLLWKNIYRLCRKEKYSHIIVEFPYYSMIGAWLKKKGVFFILHAHNIEGNRFRNLQQRGWRLLRLYEKWSMKKANLVLFKTEKDKEFAIQNYSIKEEQSYVLPYGVTLPPLIQKEESRKQLRERHFLHPEGKILLFAGTFDYLPNAEAVQIIYRRIAPLLSKQSPYPFKIIICGRNYKKKFSYLKHYENANVIQTGFVKDIELYFSAADVFINPVQKADGVQTKIFDAVSYHLNVVAFEEAKEGLPLYLFNRKVFLADNNNDEDFVKKIIQALKINAETPAAFFDDFCWDNIVRKFVKKLEALSP